MSTTQREDVAITIDRAAFTGWTEIEVVRGIDSCSAVSFATSFDVSNAAARERFRPFTFRDVTVAVNGEPLFDGYLVDVDPKTTPDSTSLGVSCYSRPAALSDVNMPASSFPLEFNGLTLSQIAERVCQPFGITVTQAAPVATPETPEQARARAARITAARRRLRAAQEALHAASALPETDPRRVELQAAVTHQDSQLRHVSRSASSAAPVRIDGAPFDRVAIEPDANPWTFLSDLAKQRGVILSDTPAGELRILRSTSPGQPVASLRAGSHPLTSIVPSFSPQAYFSEMTGLGGARPGQAGSSYTARNPRLTGVIRPSTFKPEDAELADVPAAVNARMGRMFGNLVTYRIEVCTWRDPSGALWAPNTTITVVAPNAMIYRETEMLVREVTLKRTDSAISASLAVVLPGAFSGSIPSRLPWDD